MNNRKRATIRDVAALASVSPSTVSHALSGHRTISEATRRRVLDAVEKLSYGADPIAASLRNGTTGLIGLVLRPRDAVSGSLGGTDNFLHLMGAAATSALSRGWGLVHVPNSTEEYAKSLPVDGYLVVGPYKEDPVLEKIRRTRLPVATIDAMPEDAELGWNIVIDYAQGIKEMLRYVDPDCAATTALITGTERNQWNQVIYDTITDWGGGPHSLMFVETLYEGVGVAGAEKRALGLLESGVERVFAAPSRFAVGIVRAASRLGIRIPNALEVVAFTDSVMAEKCEPSVTTLDVRLDLAGAAGIELLLDRLEGGSPPAQPVVIKTEPRWRETTAWVR